MSKLRIFIEGEELDSLESVTVPITKQFEELSDPTVICNDYSKTVTVPLSKHNNEIFGHCYNPDRLTAYSGDDATPLVGIYFDPYKKLDCRLQWGDAVFFVGYAKMLKITNKGYEVTINGELGKIFQELQKITFDKSKYEDEEDIAKYWIDGSKYVDTYWNADLLTECWSVKNDNRTTLLEVGDKNYRIGDILQFTLNNSISSKQETESHLSSANSSTIVENEKMLQQNSGCLSNSLSSYTSELSPLKTQQYRSYLQFPCIYFNQYWQIFQKKAEELTGYKWKYDGIFKYNKLNYFWTKLAVSLNNYEDLNANEAAENDEKFYVYFKSTVTNPNGLIDYASDGKIAEKGTYTDKANVLLNTDYEMVQLSISESTVRFTGVNSAQAALNYSTIWRVDDNNYAYIQMFINGKPFVTFVNKEVYSAALSHFQDGSVVVPVENQSASGGTAIFMTADLPSTYFMLMPKTDKNMQFFVRSGYVGTQKYHCPIVGVYNNGTVYDPLNFVTSEFEIVSTGENSCYKNTIGSDMHITLNNLCNLDFLTILDFCKTIGVQIYADEANKTLNFVSRKDFFKDITITDFTDKIDKSSDFSISTVTTEYSSLLFGSSFESSKNDTYNTNYDIDYGQLRFNTGYNFSESEKECTTITTPIIEQNRTYKYGNLLQNKLSYLTTYPSICCYDKDNKYKSMPSGVFFFLNNYYDRDGITVTDDNLYEKASGNVYFKQNDTLKANDDGDIYVESTSQLAKTNYYYAVPLFNADYALSYPTIYFNTPLVTYVYSNFIYTQNNSIYEVYWKRYLNERYDTQNKKVTTYVRLTPTDFINFNFNQFWKIGNQVYMVNKIYDYDITSDKPTKVDLITVQNINNYK